MKRLALVAFLFGSFVGCGGRDEEPAYLVEYQIGMQSMEVIPPASASDPLVVRLTGIVGPDTRYSFERAVVNASEAEFELTLFGLRNDDPRSAFIPVVDEWFGREFEKQPPHAPSIRVILHQPDGGTLEEMVRGPREEE